MRFSSKTTTKNIAKNPEPKIPSDLNNAINANSLVLIAWKGLTPIARRDFVGWVEQAKQEETRKRRIEVTCSKLLSGKRRPCCYAIVPMNLYKALNANSKAKAKWKSLTPDERRDLIAWIDEAKQQEKHEERIQKVCKKLSV